MSILTQQVLPAGQYGWLWQYRRNIGSPGDVVTLAKAAGLRGILLKYHEDWAVQSADGVEWAEDFRALVQPCADAGLLLIPWGYVTPVAHEPATAKLIAQAVAESLPANAGAWYCFDPEIEWDRDPDAADKARLLFGALKQMAPAGRWLYSSWGWPDQHPDFPWRIWQYHCEAFLPQAYPATLGIPDPDLVWNRSYGGAQFGGPQSAAWTGPQGFRDLVPRKPIVPAFDIYGGHISRLAHLADIWGAPAVTWWVMDNFGEQTIRDLAATPYAAEYKPGIKTGIKDTESDALRAELDRERARADALQARLEQIAALAKGD